LSDPPGPWFCCCTSNRHHALGVAVSSRSSQESCIRDLRHIRRSRILRGYSSCRCRWRILALGLLLLDRCNLDYNRIGSLRVLHSSRTYTARSHTCGCTPVVEMDYLGAASIAAGLVLTVFSITQSAHAPQGWRTPYIPVCFVLGIASLLFAVYIEVRVASQPLLPASILMIPSMAPLLLSILILYGCWGIFSVYGALFFQNIRPISPLQIAVWYVPLGVAGIILSVIEGFILHLVPGRILMIIGTLGALASQLLLANVPLEGWNYWAWIFSATICSTIGIDLPTILMSVFITTKLPRTQQGLAGGLLNSVLQLGVALTLGITDLIQVTTMERHGLASSYKYTFWFGVAASAVSVALVSLWGDVPKARSDLTADERAEFIETVA
jgi:hypothetical protein